MEAIATPIYCFRGHVRDYTQQIYGSGVDACVWRELLQNARDAGATRVEITLEETEEHIVLTFRDNGKGMDRETLLKGMLTYSGSIKPGGAAGGFGMAKCLIVIGGPDRCEIRTQDLAVNVTGNRYEWATSEEYVAGTQLKLFCPKKEESTQRIAPTANGLRFLLARSDMRGMVVILNNEIVRDTPIGFDAVVVREWADMEGKAFWEKGRPAPKKSNDESVCTVTHRGIWVMDMTMPEGVKGSVTIDLLADPQRVLNAPRCSLASYAHRDHIDKLLHELAKSPEGVLRPRSFTRRWNGDGLTLLREANELAEAAFAVLTGNAQFSENTGIRVPVMNSVDDKAKFLQELGRLLAEQCTENIQERAMCLDQPEELADTERLEELTVESVRTLVWRPALMVKNERNDFDVPEKFFPENMKPRIRKILCVWNELIREFLIKNKAYITYGVGFIFSDDAQAMYHRDLDGSQWFLINPLNDKGEDRIKISDEDSCVSLVESAAHEVGHVFSRYHDEKFCLALTKNLGIAYKHKSQFAKILRTAGRD